MKKLNVLILDKTVLNKDCQEHRSFNWVLDHFGYVKPDTSFYKPEEDYYGFFPLESPQFDIRDFEPYSKLQIDSLAQAVDLLLYADSYGVYKNEWYEEGSINEYSGKVYGGLTHKDFLIAKAAAKNNKVLITEFNILASPTSGRVRKEMEQLLGVRWTGWTGRYFDILDTLANPELPRWMLNLYMEQHQEKWPFKESGIVLVHEDTRIEILDEMKDLTSPCPIIMTGDYGVGKYHVSEQLQYPFWFDITLPTSDSVKVISTYQINLTPSGEKLLSLLDLPSSFPAAMENLKGQNTYYFCGDFSDNPIPMWTRKFDGIRTVDFLFKEKQDPSNRTLFFWEYYLPMVSAIMDQNFR